jgi:hypothetical protein
VDRMFVEYLASIDWIGAVIVAVVVIAIGLVVLRFGLAVSSEVGAMLPGARDAASRRILDARTDMPIGDWVCSVCRSVNTETATRCYRGCGARDEIARPTAEEAVSDAGGEIEPPG